MISEMEKYPQSNLTDVYKSWFQSVFGPGHLLNDTTAALRYLRAELEQTKVYKDTAGWFPLGTGGRFGRLNLYVVASGKVPFNQFWDAFIKSSNEFSVPQNAAWERQWKRIQSVTEKLPAKPGNFDAGKHTIDSLLNRNEYVIHHSRRFTEVYDPHYRVISTRIYREMRKRWL